MQNIFLIVPFQLNLYMWFLFFSYQVIVGSYASWIIRTGVIVHGSPSHENVAYEESANPGLCLHGTQCTTLDRFRDLICGYRGTQPLVCCPESGFQSPWGPHGDDGDPNIPSKPVGNSDLAIDDAICGIPKVTQGMGVFPFVVRVGYINTKTRSVDYPCLGSIIGQRVILSAAHCAVAKVEGYELYHAAVGEWDTSEDPDCNDSYCARSVQRIGISHVIVHPDYNRETFKDDIALIILKNPINYTITAQPLCLMANENVRLLGRKANLVGWGLLAGQKEQPKVLQTLQLPVISLDDCIRVYRNVLPVSERQLCAGGELNKDACRGFGGGPLILPDRSQSSDGILAGKFYQVGIASFGSEDCGQQDIPGVYTKISSYLKWIKANLA